MIRVIRNLLIYAGAGIAAIVGGSAVLGVPFEWVTWIILLVEVVPLFTWGGALLVRHTLPRGPPGLDALGL